MIKVAIVEDDVRLRNSLRLVIESKPELVCVGEYGTGAEAVERIPGDQPEIVLMDLNLPDMSGAEVTSRIKLKTPALNVVVLTAYNDADHIFKALRAGACGYLLKRASAQEIVEAISDAHRGGSPMSSEIARKVIATFHAPMPAEPPLERLQPREKDILDLIAKGYANKEVADRLNLTPATVCWYLHRIYKKLHVQNRIQAVNKVRPK